MSKKHKQQRQDFLLTFFSKEPKNEKIKMNGFVLFKHYNGANGQWQVDIFTEESFNNMLWRT